MSSNLPKYGILTPGKIVNKYKVTRGVTVKRIAWIMLNLFCLYLILKKSILSIKNIIKNVMPPKISALCK
jgi:hypothetical protein